VNTKLRKLDIVSEASRSKSGSIFSFLPADGASRAGAVAQQVSRTLTEGPGGVGSDQDGERPAVLLA